MAVIVTFPCAVTRHLDEGDLEKKMFIGAHGFRVLESFIIMVGACLQLIC